MGEKKRANFLNNTNMKKNNLTNSQKAQFDLSKKQQSLTQLAPLDWYYTGFAHSDGSLFFSVEKKSNSFWGYRVTPMFAITLGIESLELLRNIARFFGCGNITIGKESATFRVTEFFHIWHIIIPHFLKYPFSGRKFLVFKIFTICCSLMLPFYHKTLPFHLVFKIIFLTFLMNEGTKRTLVEAQNLLLTIQKTAVDKKYPGAELFTNELIYSITNKALSIYQFPTEFNVQSDKYSLIAPYYDITNTYILGVFEGDGSFFIRFLTSFYIYSFGFSINTSIEDLPILINIKTRLGCGKIIIHKTWCRYEIDKIGELNNIIIPLVDSLILYTEVGLLSHKAKNYAIWKEGIMRHLNGEFSFKNSNSLLEKEMRKAALKDFIARAYNVHDKGNKRNLTLTNFLKLHGLD
jgi:hypothetical protein